jgi:ribosome maturation factor RimP
VQITPPSQTLAAHITTLVEPVAAAHGYDLEGVSVRWPEPGDRSDVRREVTITVDRDGANDLDEIAALSREISTVLDADPDVPGEPYELEVGSPGVDRPLTTARHWRRACGRKVAVDLADQDAPRVTGRAGALDDDTVTLVINERGRIHSRTIELASIAKAVVQVDFSLPSVRELELCGFDEEQIAERRQGRG